MKRIRPNFDQKIRYRLVLGNLRKYFPRVETVLEVGGGQGFFCNVLCNNEFRPILTEISFDDLRIADKSLNRICCDGIALPFKDKSFDILVAIDVIEHIPRNDRLKFVQEMGRVSSKGVILTCPTNIEPYKAFERITKLFKLNIGWYEEHEKFGIPTKHEIEAYVHVNSSMQLIETLHYQKYLSLWLLAIQYALRIPPVGFPARIKSIGWILGAILLRCM